MSGTVWLWAQADRQRGAGWSIAHLFPRDAETGLDHGYEAHCGYDPTKLPFGDVVFRAAPDDAPRCSRCERGTYVVGHTYYPLGQHPADGAPA